MQLINQIEPTIKILVVEDEIIVAEDIKDSLEGLGYSVTDIADSGKEAIAKAAEMKPDLVLMDIYLKEKMTGIQAAERIWNIFQIPIVFLTAYSDKKTIQLCKVAEPFGYITKPFQEKELHTAIEMALHRYESEKKLKHRAQWLTTILTSISDAVITTDEKGCITLLNSTAELLTGWKQSDALGKNLLEVLHLSQTNQLQDSIAQIHDMEFGAKKMGEFITQTDNSLHLLNQASFVGEASRESGGWNSSTPHLSSTNVAPLMEVPPFVQASPLMASAQLQSILIAKNGREIPIDCNAAPIQDEQEQIQGVVVVFRDITERNQAALDQLTLARNQQLEEQIAQLERLNQLKDDFLSTVAHELRTPITNMTMAVKMLELSLGRICELLSATAQQIDTSAAIGYLQILKDECGRETNLTHILHLTG